MPVNRNAVIRYQVLDRCFRNPGRDYDIEALIEACNDALQDINGEHSGVKRRQLYEDIRFMEDSRGYQAPIKRIKQGRKVYYRYSDRNFSINNQPLNQQEAEQLRETLLTLSRFRGLPQFDWIYEINKRLEQSFLMNESEAVIGFEENPYLKGREYINELFDAIKNKQVLNVVYKPFKADANIKMDIHPWYLKEYNNRWFLFAWNDKENSISNLALDRIKEISTSDAEFRENRNIDFFEYFEDVVGVSVPDEGALLHLKIKVHNSLWPYIKTKPLHGSQKTVDVNEAFSIISLDVIPNYELEALLLSFGEQVEVLEPEEFRNKIKARLYFANQQYF